MLKSNRIYTGKIKDYPFLKLSDMKKCKTREELDLLINQPRPVIGSPSGPRELI